MSTSPAHAGQTSRKASNKSNRMSRSRKKELLAQAARSVSVPPHADVCVVGAGASGVVAATVAAEKNLTVVALDSSVECAHTILATGNGRCNFSNIELCAGAFNDPEFVAPTLGDRPLDAVLGWFSECGLGWCQQEGRLYPRSLSAQSVRNVLMRRAQASGAVLAPQRQVLRIEELETSGPYRYSIKFEERFADAPAASAKKTLLAKSVILATGGGATSATAPLKLATTPYTPALCALECEKTPFTVADGKRASAACALWRDGVPLVREIGEVLFRSYGLSGIAIFNLSRLAQPNDVITLDLLWEVSASEILKRNFESAAPATNLEGYLEPELARIVEQISGTADLSQQIQCAKSLEFRVSGLADTSHAQVTRGGIALSEFDPHTLEALHHPHLFACGEALDIDGACGGYNLSWAWLSGQHAALSACAALTPFC